MKKTDQSVSYILDDIHTLNTKIKGLSEFYHHTKLKTNKEIIKTKIRDYLLFIMIVVSQAIWWLR